MVDHKFNVGDKVVFTNDFGVCWGVKIITEVTYREVSRDGLKKIAAYHYEGSDTPWFPSDEKNFTLATYKDLEAQANGDSSHFVKVHEFYPSIEQLGGCY